MGFGGRVGDRTFASEYEGVIPDMLVLDKDLTGRYLPLAITLVSEKLSSGIRWVGLLR
jgi:adenosylmethionine-8-amino-7-oxononanoate aminotransferase